MRILRITRRTPVGLYIGRQRGGVYTRGMQTVRIFTGPQESPAVLQWGDHDDRPTLPHYHGLPYYLNSCRTACGLALACANIAVEAWARI